MITGYQQDEVVAASILTSPPSLPSPVVHKESTTSQPILAGDSCNTNVPPTTLTISDFSWHHIPCSYRLPLYHTLGTCMVEADCSKGAVSMTGKCCFLIENPENIHLLSSGVIWFEYAQQSFQLLNIDGELALLLKRIHQFRDILVKQRPLSSEVCIRLYQSFNDTFFLNAFNSHTEEGLLDADHVPELYMVFKYGIITGSGHLPLMCEKSDFQDTLGFLCHLFGRKIPTSFSSLSSIFSNANTLLLFIKEIHRRLLASSATSRGFTAGQWRNENVCLQTAKWCLPHFIEVEALMNAYTSWAANAYSMYCRPFTTSGSKGNSPSSTSSTAKYTLDPIIFALELHSRFVYIHPFADGNGRIARLLCNLALVEMGFPCILIPTGRAEKATYTTTLEEAFWGRKNPYYQFMAHLLEQSSQLYMEVLGATPTPSVPACLSHNSSQPSEATIISSVGEMSSGNMLSFRSFNIPIKPTDLLLVDTPATLLKPADATSPAWAHPATSNRHKARGNRPYVSSPGLDESLHSLHDSFVSMRSSTRNSMGDVTSVLGEEEGGSVGNHHDDGVSLMSVTPLSTSSCIPASFLVEGGLDSFQLPLSYKMSGEYPYFPYDDAYSHHYDGLVYSHDEVVGEEPMGITTNATAAATAPSTGTTANATLIQNANDMIAFKGGILSNLSSPFRISSCGSPPTMVQLPRRSSNVSELMSLCSNMSLESP